MNSVEACMSPELSPAASTPDVLPNPIAKPDSEPPKADPDPQPSLVPPLLPAMFIARCWAFFGSHGAQVMHFLRPDADLCRNPEQARARWSERSALEARMGFLIAQ
jgi:hypothetical protein